MGLHRLRLGDTWAVQPRDGYLPDHTARPPLHLQRKLAHVDTGGAKLICDRHRHSHRKYESGSGSASVAVEGIVGLRWPWLVPHLVARQARLGRFLSGCEHLGRLCRVDVLLVVFKAPLEQKGSVMRNDVISRVLIGVLSVALSAMVVIPAPASATTTPLQRSWSMPTKIAPYTVSPGSPTRASCGISTPQTDDRNGIAAMY